MFNLCIDDMSSCFLSSIAAQKYTILLIKTLAVVLFIGTILGEKQKFSLSRLTDFLLM